MHTVITRTSRASIWGKLRHCQKAKTCSTYMRHFSHRRKSTACSSQDSFAYNESHHDSYPQFPRCPLGTPGSIPPFCDGPTTKKTLAFLESCSAKASSTKKWNGYKAVQASLLSRYVFLLTFFFLLNR